MDQKVSGLHQLRQLQPVHDADRSPALGPGTEERPALGDVSATRPADADPEDDAVLDYRRSPP